MSTRLIYQSAPVPASPAANLQQNRLSCYYRRQISGLPPLNAFSTLERPTQFVGIGFVTPTFLIIALILVYPVVQSIVLSVGQSSVDGFEPYRFVGLEHYQALMGNERFWKSLTVTLVVTAISIPLVDNRLPNVARHLPTDDYQTAIVGKWHLGEGRQHEPAGFDFWSVSSGQGEYFDPLMIEMGKEIEVPDDWSEIAYHRYWMHRDPDHNAYSLTV